MGQQNNTAKAKTSSKSGKPKFDIKILTPIILSFFFFVLLGTAGLVTNNVQNIFGLSHSSASLLASAIYIWFLVIPIPTGYIMNSLGHKKTVLLALSLSIISLIFPIIHYSYLTMIISLSILGIANTILQISLNLLVSDVTAKKQMSSMLTLGQFVGQIPAMIIPLLAMWSVALFGSWHWVYPLFLIISIAITYYLFKTEVKETEDKDPSSFKDLIGLFKNKIVLFCFLAIICQVGVDVGTSITTPKIIMGRTGVNSDVANFVTSVYAMVRLAGCLLGAYLLANFSNRKIYIASITLLILGSVGLIFFSKVGLLHLSTAAMGLGISNLFAIIFSQALESKPKRKNNISSLMIMGLVGGAIFPPLMGTANKIFGGGQQYGAIIVILACVGFMGYMAKIIKDE